ASSWIIEQLEARRRKLMSPGDDGTPGCRERGCLGCLIGYRSGEHRWHTDTRGLHGGRACGTDIDARSRESLRQTGRRDEQSLSRMIIAGVDAGIGADDPDQLDSRVAAEQLAADALAKAVEVGRSCGHQH